MHLFCPRVKRYPKSFQTRASDFLFGHALAVGLHSGVLQFGGLQSRGLHFRGLGSRETDFGSGHASTRIGGLHSGDLHFGRLHSGGFLFGGLVPRATDFGSGHALTGVQLSEGGYTLGF